MNAARRAHSKSKYDAYLLGCQSACLPAVNQGCTESGIQRTNQNSPAKIYELQPAPKPKRVGPLRGPENCLVNCVHKIKLDDFKVPECFALEDAAVPPPA